MKRFAFVLFVIVVTIGHSQDNKQSNKLEYKSVSFAFSPLAIYFDSETGGVVLNLDAGFVYKKHILTFSITNGSEFTVLGSSDSFEQVNVLYGKELMLNKTIFIDTHLGLGYFSFKPAERNLDRQTTLGIPLAFKLRFKTGKKFSIGLQFQANINSVNNIYNTGILFQWNKR